MRLRNLFHSITIADAVLFSLLVLSSLSGVVMINQVVSFGQNVHIEVGGKTEYILPLDSDRVLSVPGPLGQTEIEIKDHRVRVTDSPCNNKLCIYQGWTQNGTIVCLPNRVLITIEAPAREGETVDAITG